VLEGPNKPRRSAVWIGVFIIRWRNEKAFSLMLRSAEKEKFSHERRINLSLFLSSRTKIRALWA
jgi:hypothetical protein